MIKDATYISHKLNSPCPSAGLLQLFHERPDSDEPQKSNTNHASSKPSTRATHSFLDNIDMTKSSTLYVFLHRQGYIHACMLDRLCMLLLTEPHIFFFLYFAASCRVQGLPTPMNTQPLMPKPFHVNLYLLLIVSINPVISYLICRQKRECCL